MKNKNFNEFELIAEIRKWTQSLSVSGLWLRTGIGDDAAVFRPGKDKDAVLTTDSMAEGVHFNLTYMTLADVGWKSLAMNLSDIAAMGAAPKGALISLHIPEHYGYTEIKNFYSGLLRCARKYRTAIIGGNISRSAGGFMVSITVIGETKRGCALKRDGAKADDVIAVTGFPGCAQAGMKVLRNKLKSNIFTDVIRRHCRPEPRLSEIRRLLTATIKVNACIDISDGLSADLKHVCEASRCGAVIEEAALPIHPELKKAAQTLHENAAGYALGGGEDYELILTMPPKDFIRAKKIMKHTLTAIGIITKTKDILIVRSDGKQEKLPITGYQHF